MTPHNEESVQRGLREVDGMVVGRRRLLGAGSAVGLGVSSLLLPAVSAAASGGASATTEPGGFTPSTVGAEFYMVRRSDVQISVGWVRASGDEPFTFDITVRVISDGDPGTAPTPVPGAVVTKQNETALAPGALASDFSVITINSLWTGAWTLNNGSVVEATLVSNTSPAVTVVLTRAWGFSSGDTLTVTT